MVRRLEPPPLFHAGDALGAAHIAELVTQKAMAVTIQDRVFRVISTSRRIPLVTVQPDCTFEELGIDSLDRLNILFDLESEFEIEIDDEEAKIATKVSDIVAGVKRLVEAAGTAS